LYLEFWSQKQLSEMAKGREMANQPLPYLGIEKVFLEKSRVFYTPPENRISIQSRLIAVCKVKNVGTGVAISIDIIPKITANISKIDFEAKTIAKRIVCLELNCINNDEISSVFLDRENEILKTLAQGKMNNYPIISLVIPYQNFLGVPFKVECRYRIYPDIDDKDKLKEWLNFIVTLKIKYKDTIEEIVSTLKEDKEKGRPKFIEFMKGFNNDVPIVAKQNLDLFPNLIPSSFKVSVITPEEYENLVGAIKYGSRPFFRKNNISKKQ